MDQLELDFGVTVFTDYDVDGHLEIGVDFPGLDGSEGVAPIEALLPYGLLSRHLDPDKDSKGKPTDGAGLLLVKHGDARHAFQLTDHRIVSKLPKVRKGGSGLYGGSGDFYSFVLIDGLDPAGVQKSGSITVAASYDKNGSKASMGLSFNVRTPGDEQITLLHGEGHGLKLGASGKRSVAMTNAKGTAWIETNDSGNVLAGNTKIQGSMTTGAQTAARPVALAEPVAAALSALAAAVAAIPGGQGAPAAIAGFLGAIAAKHSKST